MRVGIFGIVREGLQTILNSPVEGFQFSLGVAETEISQAAQVFPDVMLRGSLFLPFTDHKSEDVIVQLTGEFAIEVAQSKVLQILRPGLAVLLTHPQTFRQPE